MTDLCNWFTLYVKPVKVPQSILYTLKRTLKKSYLFSVFLRNATCVACWIITNSDRGKLKKKKKKAN